MKVIIRTSLVIISFIIIMISAGRTTGSFRFSECLSDSAGIDTIKESRILDENIAPSVYFGEQKLILDYETKTYYYSLTEGSEMAYDPAVSLKDCDPGFKIAFEGPGFTEKSIADNIPAGVLIYSENSYNTYSLVCTTLPLINIDCPDEIGTDDHNMSISVYDNSEGAAFRFIQASGLIHLRGASSTIFPKKSYRISLEEYSVGQNKRKREVSLLGMKKNTDWILYAAYDDQEKIRNVFSQNLWTRSCGTDNGIGLFTGVEYKYAELFFNGHYGGLYALGYPFTERTVGLNGDLMVNALFKLYDWVNDEPVFLPDGKIEGYELKHSSNVYTGLLKKKAEVQESSAWEMLADYLSGLNTHSHDDAYLMNGIDMDNAIDLMLFINLIQGLDNVSGGDLRNAYIVLKREENGIRAYYCPWDFDRSWGNAFVLDPEVNNVAPYNFLPDENYILRQGYLNRLLQNEEESGGHVLHDRIREKYRELREDAWSDETIISMLEGYEKDIFDSGAYLREMKRHPLGTYSDPSLRLDKFEKYVTERLSECDKYYGTGSLKER